MFRWPSTSLNSASAEANSWVIARHTPSPIAHRSSCYHQLGGSNSSAAATLPSKRWWISPTPNSYSTILSSPSDQRPSYQRLSPIQALFIQKRRALLLRMHTNKGYTGACDQKGQHVTPEQHSPITIERGIHVEEWERVRSESAENTPIMGGYIQRSRIQSRGTTGTVIMLDRIYVGRISTRPWSGERERGEWVVRTPIVGEDTERSYIQIRGTKGHVTTGKSMFLWRIGT